MNGSEAHSATDRMSRREQFWLIPLALLIASMPVVWGFAGWDIASGRTQDGITLAAVWPVVVIVYAIAAGADLSEAEWQEKARRQPPD